MEVGALGEVGEAGLEDVLHVAGVTGEDDAHAGEDRATKGNGAPGGTEDGGAPFVGAGKVDDHGGELAEEGPAYEVFVAVANVVEEEEKEDGH
ncbi:hypothetical protein AMTR_s00060p00162410 [Amborella trichopoda]|uniref:Uncharacterized protein n=1 Tax=Amborella trichopoda TaxID=13333 RepID=W1NKA6_AMBTC|nr:hypothetical protein AMTR_s00060p00162410 [Amborella trichopoda]